jgi:hypothetical protein
MTNLSRVRYSLAGAGTGGLALFAGCDHALLLEYWDGVDVYDGRLNTELAHPPPTNLSQPRYNLAGAEAEGLILFAGGSTVPGYSGVVDV